MEKSYTPKQAAVKEQFCRDRGAWKWNDMWDTILSLNEDIVGAYSTLSSVPHKRGYLDQKVTSLVYVAIDSAITHMYISGMKNHLRHGIKDLGISPEEFMEVLAITSTVGAGTFTECYSMFTKALRDNQIEFDRLHTEADAKIMEDSKEELGEWTPLMEDVLALNPDMFRAYIDYLKAAKSKNALDAKTREFIYIAVNAAPTTLNAKNVYTHCMKALELGATKEELSELFELVSCLGIHTVLIGIPAMKEIID